jgi:hypothetical protein
MNAKTVGIRDLKELITLMTEAVRTSETSVYFNETTRRCIPEGFIIFWNNSFAF